MQTAHNPKLRFGISLHDSMAARFSAGLANAPPLPAIDFGLVGKAAPTLPVTPPSLPKAETIIITWADAEWAALQHVFCGGAVEPGRVG
jgi:hypothetical protein